MGILASLLGKNTLYYPGCMVKKVLPEINENYRNLLRACGVDFIELEKLELCCSSPVANAGFAKDAKKVAEKNRRIFEDYSVGKLITPCPACAHMFRQQYRRWLGDKWDVEVEHVSETLRKALTEKKLRFKQALGKVTYHDPCYLSRHQNITEEPRELLLQVAKKIVEMEQSGKDTYCCGGGGGVRATNESKAKDIGKIRVGMAKKTKADVLVTVCPMCYYHLKESAGDEFEVMELSEALIKGLQK